MKGWIFKMAKNYSHIFYVDENGIELIQFFNIDRYLIEKIIYVFITIKIFFIPYSFPFNVLYFKIEIIC